MHAYCKVFTLCSSSFLFSQISKFIYTYCMHPIENLKRAHACTSIGLIIVCELSLSKSQVPLFWMFIHDTYQYVPQAPIDQFSMAIILRVISITKNENSPQFIPYISSGMINKLCITVRHNTQRKPMQLSNFRKEYISDTGCIISLITCNKRIHFIKSIKHNINWIMTSLISS